MIIMIIIIIIITLTIIVTVIIVFIKKQKQVVVQRISDVQCKCGMEEECIAIQLSISDAVTIAEKNPSTSKCICKEYKIRNRNLKMHRLYQYRMCK